MSPVLTAALVLVGAAFILGLGLQIKPRPFNLLVLGPTESRQIPIPGGLPAPVERFYRTVYGGTIPVVDSVVLAGRGRIRPFGIWLPVRFVFVHQAGHNYRHYIEATFFGLPFLKVNEGYLQGASFFESPMGTYFNDPNTNQGANLALWAEAGWFPSLWLTDPRVRWQAVDEATALLYVPFENQTEHFVMRFNPHTGLLDLMEAMRFREPGTGKSKILWLTSNVGGRQIPDTRLNARGGVTWLDQGQPWACFDVEELAINRDVSEYIRSRGH